jgi:hypothetical protein
MGFTNQTEITATVESYNGTKITTIIPPESTERLPIHIIAVVDISGSMGRQAGIPLDTKDPDSEKDSNLTRMDFTKLALKTLVKSMNRNDRISIITFNCDTHIIGEYIDCGEYALQKIDEIHHSKYCTDIWKGLKKGLEMDTSTNYNNVVILFTDGDPNPPRDNMDIPYNPRPEERDDMLFLDYIKRSRYYTLPRSLYIFGFGPEVKDDILYKMAEYGNGLYTHIVYGSWVVPTFSHIFGNIATTIGTNIKVNDARIPGTLNMGQNRYINFSGQIEYFDISRDKIVYIEPKNIDSSDMTLDKNITKFYVETCKELFLKCVQDLLVLYPTNCNDLIAKTIMQIQQISDEMSEVTPFIKLMLMELNERISKSISNDERFANYGKQFLLTVLSSHKNYVRTNGRNKSIRHYGGNEFVRYQEYSFKMFNELSISGGTIKRKRLENGQVVTVPMTDTSQYGRNNDPCFIGTGIVTVLRSEIIENNNLNSNSDNNVEHIEKIMIQDVKKGNYIYSKITINGEKKEKWSKVLCVVKTELSDAIMMTFLDENFIISPKHPIFENGDWIRPIDRYMSKKVCIKEIYNFILEDGHTILVNDKHTCVTLGHNSDNSILKHDYYGRDIVEKIKQMEGWEDGLVIFSNFQLIK